jgi:hypothetical protein
MAINYPIIETQMRLIRALQKGYVEALEAGDWQAADYRCAHLQKLCEGLYYLSQLLEKENRLPEGATPRNPNNWVNSIRSVGPTESPTQALGSADKPGTGGPAIPDPARYIWNSNSQSLQPPIDEVWQ